MEDIRDEEPFFRTLLKTLSAQFGPNCEIVLHDLKNQPYDHTIVAIENGHVTGRKVGDCGTNLGLQVLRGVENDGNKYNYFTRTKGNRILRSSTLYIRNSAGKVIGALCINFDITDFILAEKSLNYFTDQYHKEGVPEVEEYFANDVNELLQKLIEESVRHIGKPLAYMTKNDKIEAIRYLDEKGAFLIKKSGDKIAKFYDISKYSLYSYLEEIRSQKNPTPTSQIKEL